MAAKTYIARVAGKMKQVAAVVISQGASSDGAIVALDAQGKLDASVLPSGIGVNTVSATASEALSADDMVNIYDNAGTVSVRKADATGTGKQSHGFVKAAFASGAAVTIYTSGSIVTGVSGLTTGESVYLSKTAGGATSTPLSDTGETGNTHQVLGKAVSATSFIFEPEEPIELA